MRRSLVRAVVLTKNHARIPGRPSRAALPPRGRAWLLLCGIGLVLLRGVVLAQSAPAVPSPPTPTALHLVQAEVGALKIERAQLRIQLRALQAQLETMTHLVQVLLRQQTEAENTALNTELRPLEEALVAAWGGDYAKGDRFNFTARTLTKAPRAAGGTP